MTACIAKLAASNTSKKALIVLANPAFRVVKRCLLSSSYAKDENLLKFIDEKKRETGDTKISSVCLLIDRCNDKKQPFSSLTIDKMVNAIEDSEDVKTSMYYLYQFRRSKACYFLRPWTGHMWIRKCIECGTMSLALRALKESVHFGIFPDAVSFNMLLDHCLKEQKFNEAFEIASHMFLHEAINSKVSQILCLATLQKFAEKNQEEGSATPQFSTLVEKRNFGGICFRLGQLMKVKSLELIGTAILGSIEEENSIRAVYQEPWAPLLWKEGYLEDGLSILRMTETPVSQEAVEILLAASAECELLKDVEKAVSDLKHKNLIGEEENMSMLVQQFKLQINQAEVADMTSFKGKVLNWITEHREIDQLEKEIMEERRIEREILAEEKRIRNAARKLAVEKLGYWELLNFGKGKKLAYYLREDYVEGSSCDIDIERKRITDDRYFYEVQ